MKNPSASCHKRAFTLLELLVAMAITTIIVTVLVSITAIAIDTWNRSRSELRAARQAKSMVDSMARDLEALVTRRGNQFEWLTVKAESPDESSSASTLVFFTAATDRYDGEIGSAKDLGGDVSCVGYQLAWKDPIAGDDSFETFVLNRHLVDPKGTFESLLGKTDLATAFTTKSDGGLDNQESFVCENVFQFAITFHIQVTTTTTTPTGTTSTTQNKRVNIGPSESVKKFSIKGTGIVTDPVDETLSAGKITSVGISLSVLSDAGIDQLRKNSGKANDAKWLAKNSYQYSKLVQLPGM